MHIHRLWAIWEHWCLETDITLNYFQRVRICVSTYVDVHGLTLDPPPRPPHTPANPFTPLRPPTLPHNPTPLTITT